MDKIMRNYPDEHRALIAQITRRIDVIEKKIDAIEKKLDFVDEKVERALTTVELYEPLA